MRYNSIEEMKNIRQKMDLKFVMILTIIKTASSQDCFTCPDGSDLSIDGICDGHEDCQDGWDETNCEPPCSTECPNNYIRCGSSCQCVKRVYTCNGLTDCINGTDESLPECTICKKDEFQCANGQCIWYEDLCDSYEDCYDDGIDEDPSICELPCSQPCPDAHFRCGNSCQCVSKFFICDGYDDCTNGADEQLAECNKIECLECSSYKHTSSNGVDSTNVNKNCENGVEGTNVTTARCYRCLSYVAKINGFMCSNGAKEDYIEEHLWRSCMPFDDRFPLGCIDIQATLQLVEDPPVTYEACVCDADRCTCECDSSASGGIVGTEMTIYMLIMFGQIQRLFI